MTTYSLIDLLLASPVNPTPQADRELQLTKMWDGLASIETAERPSNHDWRLCSDAVNLMETLVRDMKLAEDNNGLLADAVKALAIAGARSLEGHPIRLDGPGIHAVRALLEDYAALLEQLSHRTMLRCHQLTEKRIREINAGKRQFHDVEVISL